jgi:hypothetical protein
MSILLKLLSDKFNEMMLVASDRKSLKFIDLTTAVPYQVGCSGFATENWVILCE